MKWTGDGGVATWCRLPSIVPPSAIVLSSNLGIGLVLGRGRKDALEVGLSEDLTWWVVGLRAAPAECAFRPRSPRATQVSRESLKIAGDQPRRTPRPTSASNRRRTRSNRISLLHFPGSPNYWPRESRGGSRRKRRGGEERQGRTMSRGGHGEMREGGEGRRKKESRAKILIERPTSRSCGMESRAGLNSSFMSPAWKLKMSKQN